MSRASKLTLGEGDMRVNAAVALLIISAAFSGCFEEDDGFQWPEPTSSECELELDELGCTTIIEGSETPHRSLINPLTGNQWILYLNGYVKSWDGQTLDWAVDLSEGFCTKEVRDSICPISSQHHSTPSIPRPQSEKSNFMVFFFLDLS